MPPKKEPKQEKVLLGRPGNNLKAGIVGLANIGKSSLFNALTKSQLSDAQNYPFCTIDPCDSRCIVPSPRLDRLTELYKPASTVPAFLTIYDIAGLIKGAHEGEGLGAEFLSHIRAVDAIYQLVRCFDDAEVTHVEGDVDPVRDLEIIKDELRLKDIEFAQKHLEGVEKIAKRGGQSLEVKQKKEEAEFVKRIISDLENGKRVYDGNWSPKEAEIINSMYLLTAKPIIYLVNLSERDYIRKKNKWLLKIKEWVDKNSPNDAIIPISVPFEERLARMESDAEREEECKNVGATSAFDKLITTMRKKMDIISFFTAGADECREWSIRRFTKCPAAAGVIHTDFQKTFILAQIMKFEDIDEHKDEAAVKAAGKLMQKGKEYVVEDGDVIYFRSGAGKN